jgi:hypothetical protein
VDESWQHPRWGIEFDWLATDTLGSVALLSSAGYGVVPPVVIQHVDQVDDAVDIIGQLPATGAATDVITPTGGDYSDWHQAAARGLYAYDWHQSHGPYQRLASPTKPISIDELPPSVKAAAQLIKISVPFSTADSITIDLLTDPPH